MNPCAIPIGLCALLALPAQAATTISDSFDTGAGRWQAISAGSRLVYNPVLGDPGGALEVFNPGPATAIGAVNRSPTHARHFTAGAWAIGFDVSYGATAFSATDILFRYRSSNGPGWRYRVDPAPASSSGWRRYTVQFDTRWSDAEAEANGWVRGAGAPHFAKLWSDVYSTEIRIAASAKSVALVDNFTALGPPQKTVPAGAGLLLTALGLGCAIRQRRRG